ncbi:nucleotidyl transferase [Oscillochloris trichoides DG-6]|uniref:Nucleotidyl transferase n=1 Tax=Oscillochloris trichoides DG-6 TaxID=765420 RepID=E1IC96_9CHLR|nr:sugar phosphate nucleotidyltransferase [Oscillochloris trichoides]EFO81213.1 nucleotidyl transferase [Oscillochloris trichoides DG-6]
MKAVILVGGLGTRLRPLTCNTPKPMIPLVNQPFIEAMLLRLRDQGIDEVVLAVQYLADRFVAALGDGSRLNMKLHIIEEPEPRGTAGAVKNVEHLLDGTTFVFNGDVMTDLDLRAMLAYHREKQSKVTISLTPVDDPTQFGLVEMGRDNRVSRFLEKPRAEDITTNLINAGTYIIEPEVLRYVPPAQFYMFERGLFPVILQTGDPMFGFPSRAYWTDIGKPQTYLDVHHDILIGKVRYNFQGQQIADRVWLEGDADIHPSAQIVGPLVIGHGVSIGRGARIIGPSVIGPNCTIGPDVSIEGVVLWEGNQIAEGAVLRNCVLGRNNQIGPKTQISDGAIISDECNLGGDNRLEHGIRIWPGTQLGEQAISF